MKFYIITFKDPDGEITHYAYSNYHDVIDTIDTDDTEGIIKLFDAGYTISIKCIDSNLIKEEHDLADLIVFDAVSLKNEVISKTEIANLCNSEGKINAAVNLAVDYLNGDIDDNEYVIKYELQMIEFMSKPNKKHNNIQLKEREIYTTRARRTKMGELAESRNEKLKENYPNEFENYMAYLWLTETFGGDIGGILYGK